MFEDSTFESGGKIKSKSGRWMMLTFIINGVNSYSDDPLPAHLPRGVAEGDDADAARRSPTSAAAATTPTSG